MTRYAPLVPGITVYGKTLLIVHELVQAFAVLREALVDALGHAVVDPERWYPQEDVLRVYHKVDALLGGRGCERLGRLVEARAMIPPGLADVHGVLAGLDAIYHLNHRRDGAQMFDPATGAMLEGIGHYHYEGRAGAREAVMRCDNPYPCRFDLGLFHGFAARFEPGVSVTHEPGACRRDGDAACVYRARW